jgi:hypothetical protein
VAHAPQSILFPSLMHSTSTPYTIITRRYAKSDTELLRIYCLRVLESSPAADETRTDPPSQATPAYMAVTWRARVVRVE